MDNTIDIFRIVNGQYKTESVYQTLYIKDSSKLDEILEFCNENNVLISEPYDDILICKDTKQPKYYIR